MKNSFFIFASLLCVSFTGSKSIVKTEGLITHCPECAQWLLSEGSKIWSSSFVNSWVIKHNKQAEKLKSCEMKEG